MLVSSEVFAGRGSEGSAGSVHGEEGVAVAGEPWVSTAPIPAPHPELQEEELW